MRKNVIKCSDGSTVIEHIPESASDIAELARMVKADPDEWDLGDGRAFGRTDASQPSPAAEMAKPVARFPPTRACTFRLMSESNQTWRGDSQRNRFVSTIEPLVSIAPENGAEAKSWLVIDEREDPPALYRHATFLEATRNAEVVIETLGESDGHPFRDNQWTGGTGYAKSAESPFAGSPEEQIRVLHRGQQLSDECSMESLPPGKAEGTLKWLKEEHKLTPKIIEDRFQTLVDKARGTEVWERGMDWYPSVNRLSGELAAKHNSTVSKVAGVFAAISPGRVWETEEPLARYMIEAADGKRAKLPDGHIDNVISKLTTDEKFLGLVRSGATYREPHEANPAVALLTLRQQFISEGGTWAVGKGYRFDRDGLAIAMGSGTPDQILGGIKTRSFHNNILDPYRSSAVTSDKLMAEAAQNSTYQSEALYAGGEGSSKVGVEGGRSVKYAIHPVVSDAVRNIAAREGISPGAAQAIIWTQWRDDHPAPSKSSNTKAENAKKAKIAEGKDKMMAPNLGRGWPKDKLAKFKKSAEEKHARPAPSEQIPVVVEPPEPDPVYPEWFQSFLEANTLEEQVAVLSEAEAAGLLPGMEKHGEGPGHAFRGNQWTGGEGGSGGSAEKHPSIRLGGGQKVYRPRAR